MKPTVLYPPNGGKPITPHPSKVEEMKQKGFVESPKRTKKATTAEDQSHD